MNVWKGEELRQAINIQLSLIDRQPSCVLYSVFILLFYVISIHFSAYVCDFMLFLARRNSRKSELQRCIDCTSNVSRLDI